MSGFSTSKGKGAFLFAVARWFSASRKARAYFKALYVWKAWRDEAERNEVPW